MSAIFDIPIDPICRDRWGRPVIDGTTYLRPSSLGKILDDQGGLLGWGKRVVAFGLADRPELLALMQTIDREDRKAVNRLCEQAAEAGGSTTRRDLGSAIHKVLELNWSDPGYIPPAQFAAHVDAVNHQLEACGLTVVPESLERFAINEQHQSAGSFDLILTDGEENYITDIKTGSSVALGALSFSVQLACYANSEWLYDGTTRTPMFKVSGSTGVIIHTQPDNPTCTLYWIDLEVGVQALELALEVREMRKAKPLATIEPVAAVAEVETAATPGERWRQWITDRVITLIDNGHTQLIADEWPEELPRLGTHEPYDEEQTEDVEQTITRLEKLVSASFPPAKPVAPVVPVVPAVEIRRPRPDELGYVDAQTIADTKARVDLLDANELEWFLGSVAACKKANYPINLTGPSGKPSARRHAIVLALLAFAPHMDNEIFAAAIWLARETEPDATTLGELCGSMTFVEAHHTISLADDMRTGNRHLIFDVDSAKIVKTIDNERS